MFATMRRKNRNAKMKSELGQSVDHFKRAASLAAQETSATVGPRFEAARDRVQPAATKAKGVATSGWGSAVATLGPIVAAASENAKTVGNKSVKVNKKVVKASRKDAKKIEKRAQKIASRNRSGRGKKLVGLALVGAAVGAAGAYFLRKRRDDQWDEYNPAGPVDTAATVGAEDAAFEPADLAGPSGFVTPPGETEPVVPVGDGDQTSSKLHSPEVSRMASGQNKN